jgi:DNA-binding Lrp family transcriptional regulator
MPSAFLLINCKLGSDKEVMNRVKEIPVVIQAYRVYGAYDIIVRVAAGTVEKLQQALVSYRRSHWLQKRSRNMRKKL